MANNLEWYEGFSHVPAEAQKQITAGRLKGFTDINPMWRIKTLTEKFGPPGVGWKTVKTAERVVEGADGVKCAFLDIDLYVRTGDGWSEPIFGTGGSAFVSKEKNGYYTNDECFKMAYTDAFSVACKSLGMGAEVYWGADRRKPDTDGLAEHDVLAVQRRIQLLLSAKMREKGLSMEETARRLGMSVKKVQEMLGWCSTLDKLEKEIRAL